VQQVRGCAIHDPRAEERPARTAAKQAAKQPHVSIDPGLRGAARGRGGGDGGAGGGTPAPRRHRSEAARRRAAAAAFPRPPPESGPFVALQNRLK